MRLSNEFFFTTLKNYSGNTLKIPVIRKEDRGTYYCVAENGVGRGARRNINVEIEFAPVITAPRPRLGQALQYDMDLECHVEAYPPPAIVWLKDNFQLSNNQHYSISHFATADQYTDTTIRVITIEKRQYGEYVCRAANKLGTAETKVELFGMYSETYVCKLNNIYYLRNIAFISLIAIIVTFNCRIDKYICIYKLCMIICNLIILVLI